MKIVEIWRCPKASSRVLSIALVSEFPAATRCRDRSANLHGETGDLLIRAHIVQDRHGLQLVASTFERFAGIQIVQILALECELEL